MPQRPSMVPPRPKPPTAPTLPTLPTLSRHTQLVYRAHYLRFHTMRSMQYRKSQGSRNMSNTSPDSRCRWSQTRQE